MTLCCNNKLEFTETVHGTGGVVFFVVVCVVVVCGLLYCLYSTGLMFKVSFRARFHLLYEPPWSSDTFLYISNKETHDIRFHKKINMIFPEIRVHIKVFVLHIKG